MINCELCLRLWITVLNFLNTVPVSYRQIRFWRSEVVFVSKLHFKTTTCKVHSICCKSTFDLGFRISHFFMAIKDFGPQGLRVERSFLWVCVRSSDCEHVQELNGTACGYVLTVMWKSALLSALPLGRRLLIEQLQYSSLEEKNSGNHPVPKADLTFLSHQF